ncbi:hypothetical protein K438DRAFT_834957 [Mycena galopus ATCC 62051]|nr:hypothetical protein K438DRAFT_834957 [Mycena galopus ATCC 62051]
MTTLAIVHACVGLFLYVLDCPFLLACEMSCHQKFDKGNRTSLILNFRRRLVSYAATSITCANAVAHTRRCPSPSHFRPQSVGTKPHASPIDFRRRLVLLWLRGGPLKATYYFILLSTIRCA